MAKRLKAQPDSKELVSLRKKNAELLAIIDQMNESAAEQRRAKFTIPRTRPLNSFRLDFCVVVANSLPLLSSIRNTDSRRLT